MRKTGTKLRINKQTCASNAVRAALRTLESMFWIQIKAIRANMLSAFAILHVNQFWTWYWLLLSMAVHIRSKFLGGMRSTDPHAIALTREIQQPIPIFDAWKHSPRRKFMHILPAPQSQRHHSHSHRRSIWDKGNVCTYIKILWMRLLNFMPFSFHFRVQSREPHQHQHRYADSHHLVATCFHNFQERE